jgi:tRNA nucleotidyltransferase (CCA-adding enzyme)
LIPHHALAGNTVMDAMVPQPVICSLQEAGGRIYSVGGTVRDTLLGRARKDIDLLVTGLPQQTLIQCLRQYGRVQLIGRAFGVLQFRPRHWEGPPIDIALPRTEISTGIGHRDFDVSFDHTLPVETDLGRRDFTINALAIDLVHGQMIDPFGGRQDLENRLLRQVSPQAFPEDPLRMLRGVQLAARFGLRIESTTQQAMATHAGAIVTIAPERIAEELGKLFQAPSPAFGFVVMQHAGLLAHIMPELDALAGIDHRFTRTMQRLDAVQQRPELRHQGHLDLLLAALLQDSGYPAADAPTAARLARERLAYLRMTVIGAQLNRIESLLCESRLATSTLATDAALRHFAHRLRPEVASMVFDLRLADDLASTSDQAAGWLGLQERLQREIDNGAPLTVKDLAINGHDLQRLGIPQGPQMGRLLAYMLDQVLDDPSRNTPDNLIDLVQRETVSRT